MCSAKSADIPTLTITHKDGRTVLEPPLMTDRNGTSLVRGLTVKFGVMGEPAQLIADFLPSEVLLSIGSPKLAFTIDGQEIAGIIMRNGQLVRFD